MAVAVLVFQVRESNDPRLVVFTASSMAYVLEMARDPIEKAAGARLVIVEAASSTLARQIAEGAPADVFISADKTWLDYLKKGGHFDGAPVEIARNRLVWTLSFSKEQIETIKKTVTEFRKELGEEGGLVIQDNSSEPGMFITGDPEYVPLGQYAKEALSSAGLWEKYKDEIVPAENARKAVFLMEMQPSARGILYRTDALSSKNIIIIDEIPEEFHSPIIYWAVVVRQTNPAAIKKFMIFLQSEAFKTILEEKGFEVN